MMVGVYGLPGAYDAVRAVHAGFAALGFTPRYRNPNAWSGDGSGEPFGIVAVAGLKAQCTALRDYYVARGVPVLVFDLGYVRRAFAGKPNPSVTHQLGVARLNWVPPDPCPPDRLHKLDVTVAPQCTRPDDAPVLLIGQKINDAAHGMDELSMLTWAYKTIRTIRRYTRRPILWRPHPHSPHMVVPSSGISVGPISEALRTAGVVVTYNSNAGHDALLAGVSVICDTKCHYRAAAPFELDDIERAPILNTHARTEYFARLAYGQWTTPELESGEALRFILPYAGIDAAQMPRRGADNTQRPGALTERGRILDVPSPT